MKNRELKEQRFLSGFFKFRSSVENAEHLGCPMMSRTDEYVG